VKPLETLSKRVIDAVAKDKNSDNLDSVELLHEHPEWQAQDDVSLVLQVKRGDCHFLVRGPVSRLGEGKEENQDDVPGTVPLRMR